MASPAQTAEMSQSKRFEILYARSVARDASGTSIACTNSPGASRFFM